MRRKIASALAFLLALPVLSTLPHAQAALPSFSIAVERPEGYDRELFGDWIDEDRDGCDSRKEVLSSEALDKPRIGKNCALAGGKWYSTYDGKTHTRGSALDIDHVVSVAEAWRSGGWSWTSQQRQAFYNDITNSSVLIAVTSSINKSKGDKDPKDWLPPKNKCEYIRAWVTVKQLYSLTYDSGEVAAVLKLLNDCSITDLFVTPLAEFKASGSSSASSDQDRYTTPSGSGSDSSSNGSGRILVTPGAFCSPNGALGISSKGNLYICAISSTENRNRWRRQ
jgi:hypothetical protein